MKRREWKGDTCAHCWHDVGDGLAVCDACREKRPASEVMPEHPGHAERCATRYQPPGVCACEGYRAPKLERSRQR